MIYSNEHIPVVLETPETKAIPTFLSKAAAAQDTVLAGNEYLQTLNHIANDSAVAMKALSMLERVKDEAMYVDNIQEVVQSYEETRQTVAKEIAKLMSIAVTASGHTKNIAGKFKNGGTEKKIMEYYLAHGGEVEIGLPDNRAGHEYVNRYQNGYKQDFVGGESGICLIMSGSAGAFLLKDPFHDDYWAGDTTRKLKFPISDQYQNGSVLQQDFEGGFMTFAPEDNEVLIYYKSKR